MARHPAVLQALARTCRLAGTCCLVCVGKNLPSGRNLLSGMCWQTLADWEELAVRYVVAIPGITRRATLTYIDCLLVGSSRVLV